MRFVKEYLVKDLLFTSPENPIKYLIFDNTDIAKMGNTIEGVSTIFNPVNKTFYFRFKLLVAGHWNASIFIPVDFNFHREKKNSQNKYNSLVRFYKYSIISLLLFVALIAIFQL